MENRWIHSRRWDLTWLIGSVVTVPLAPLMFMAFRAAGLTVTSSANLVAMVVMFAVGGPHVFVTFTRTNMDPKFTRNHKVYTRLAFLVPVLTAAFALNFTPLFLTVFFTWASLHVLQQIAYLTNCYSNREKVGPSPRERLVEYGLIFSCLYPFATIRMVEGTFLLDGTQLLVPEALLGPGLIWVAFGIFGTFLVAWLVATYRRAVEGTLHYGKTGLIAATVGATLFTPLFPNLDVAFQGINTWHCVQYLALIWWANRLRQEKGEQQIGFVRALSERGWTGFFRYYVTSVVATVALVGVIYGLHLGLGVSFLLAYYMFGKGFLLTHYYYDTFLFTQEDELTAPSAVGAHTQPVAVTGLATGGQ